MTERLVDLPDTWACGAGVLRREPARGRLRCVQRTRRVQAGPLVVQAHRPATGRA